MSLFEELDDALRSGGADAVLETLSRRAKDEQDYGLLFRTRMLQARYRAGLPLLDNESPEALREPLEAAAREAGELFLAAGNIPAAWPYFRAIGDPAPVAAAIEAIHQNKDARNDDAQNENLERTIQIAFQEGVHRRKGFELILNHHGICRALTAYGSIPEAGVRQHCLVMLIRSLYDELISALRQATGSEEASLRALISGREWLFEGANQYVDSTHLATLLRFAPELEDPEALQMALEMAEYGERLSPMFHFRGDPPFEDTYRDNAIYLRALLGKRIEQAVAHFRAKITESSMEQGDTTPAEVLVHLLFRLQRLPEAIEASLAYLPNPCDDALSCPSVLELCQLAGDYSRMREIGRQREDRIAFAAGLIQKPPTIAKLEESGR